MKLTTEPLDQMLPIIKTFGGYTKITWSWNCWVQFPTGFSVRREHVFQPSWNWDRVRRALIKMGYEVNDG